MILLFSKLKVKRKFRENKLVKNFVVFEFEDMKQKLRENELVRNFVVFELEAETKIPRK